MARPDPIRPAEAGPPPAVGECVRAFEENFDFLYRTLRRHGVSAADVDDLAQEVFIVMWRAWHLFDGNRPLRPWVGGIAFRVARSHLRRSRREVPAGELEMEDESPPGEEGLAAKRARALVLQALSALPEKYRTPLVLHELEGFSMNEVAALMDVPLATAYTRIRRARLAFGKLVEQFLQAEAEQHRFTVLTPEALLVLERRPVRAPERARRNARSRLAALPLSDTTLPGLGGGSQASKQADRWPRLPTPTPVLLKRPPAIPTAVVTAGVAVVGALLWVVLRDPPRSGGLATAAAAVPEPARPATPAALAATRPPALALALPDDDDGWQAPAPGQIDVRVAARPIDRGLTGHWSFDEEPLGPVFRDLSGNNRDCLLHGIEPGKVWGPNGVRGGTIELGRRGWLECPQRTTSTGGPVAITVASWVRLRSFTYYNTAIATRQIATGFRDQFFFGFAGRMVRVTSHAWAGSIEHPLPHELGRWFHVAFTHDEDGPTRLYLDGVEVGRADGQARRNQGDITSALTIGAGQYSNNPQSVRQQLDGALDELRIYDRALMPEEIAVLASRGDSLP